VRRRGIEAELAHAVRQAGLRRAVGSVYREQPEMLLHIVNSIRIERA
jgi:hypothetical protein